MLEMVMTFGQTNYVIKINVSDHKQLNVIGSGKWPNHASC